MKVMIRLIDGVKLEQAIEAQSFVVGRSNRCAIVIPHEGVSRQHVQVDVINGDVFVTDLGSTNGVLVDGQKIAPNEKVLFQTFRELSFGAVESMQIEFETSEASRLMQNPFTNYAPSASPEKMAAGNTAVTRVESFPIKKNPPKPKVSKKQKKEAADSLPRYMMNAIVIIFLIAVAWYLYHKEPTPDGPVENPKKSEDKDNSGYI
jgi:hypothetical protein